MNNDTLNNINNETAVKKGKGFLFYFVIFLIVLIGVSSATLYAYKYTNNYIYQKKYNYAYTHLVNSITKAEDLVNLRIDIWNETLNKMKQYRINERKVKYNALFYDDFNQSIDIFFDSSVFISNCKVVTDEYDCAYNKLVELSDFPEGYEQAYNELLGLFNHSKELIDFSMNEDSISYDDFMSTFSELKKNAHHTADSVKIYVNETY